MKTKTQMLQMTGMTPILDRRIPIKARFLWAVLRHREETNPGHQFTVDELTSILDVRTETLLNYFSTLERYSCVAFKIEYSTLLLEAGANQGMSTNASAAAPDDPRRSS